MGVASPSGSAVHQTKVLRNAASPAHFLDPIRKLAYRTLIAPRQSAPPRAFAKPSHAS